MEEIDQTSSATTEEQMEMMTMMMDKFPELYTTPYNDDFMSDQPNNFFPTTPIFSNTNNPYFPDNPQAFPPPPLLYFHPQPSNNIPLPNIQFQDHPPPPKDFLYNNNNNKIKNNNNNNKSASNMAAMREMIFWIAAMQPVHIDPESVKPPKRKNVKISKDPQSVAARHRRERISERIRILQRMVPGGTKMDTASMLDEAIHYVKFLKTQIQSLERAQVGNASIGLASPPPSSSPSCCSSSSGGGVGFPVAMSPGSYNFPSLERGYQDVEDFGED